MSTALPLNMFQPFCEYQYMIQSSTLRGLALGTLFACAFASGAVAGDAPAVTKLNGKAAIAGTYGEQDNQDGEFGGLFLGSLTAPVTHDFGFQGDTVLGTRDGNEIAGIGGHFFWRDPAKGLLGITGSYLDINNSNATPDQSVTRFGGEGELYLGQFTVAVTSGYQNGSNVRDGYYGSATGYWYANDDLRFSLGATNDPVLNTAAVAGIEFQPRTMAMSGLTFFADATAGDNDYTTGQIGVRFYFGDDKSLKLRNRNDDPIANLPGDAMTSATAANQTPGQTAAQECNARPGGWTWTGFSCLGDN
tara:strand:- start:5591 stop:6505 length:915 start_codon:yes stop_codon:yes gene_type:complete